MEWWDIMYMYMYSVLVHTCILCTKHCVLWKRNSLTWTLPYSARFWRGKILANLVSQNKAVKSWVGVVWTDICRNPQSSKILPTKITFKWKLRNSLKIYPTKISRYAVYIPAHRSIYMLDMYTHTLEIKTCFTHGVGWGQTRHWHAKQPQAQLEWQST